MSELLMSEYVSECMLDTDCLVLDCQIEGHNMSDQLMSEYMSEYMLDTDCLVVK